MEPTKSCTMQFSLQLVSQRLKKESIARCSGFKSSLQSLRKVESSSKASVTRFNLYFAICVAIALQDKL